MRTTLQASLCSSSRKLGFIRRSWEIVAPTLDMGSIADQGREGMRCRRERALDSTRRGV